MNILDTGEFILSINADKLKTSVLSAIYYLIIIWGENQMKNTIYIGVDLGDKTLSMFYANSGNSDLTNNIQLPGTIGNNPLETTIGVLYSREVILADNIDTYKIDEFRKVYHNFKYQPDIVKKNAPIKFKRMEDGIRYLIDRVFDDEFFSSIIRPLLSDKDKVVFCIGYPTNWSDESRREYEEMIRKSVLGEFEKKQKYLNVPMELRFEKESTGAYTYINNLNKTTHLFSVHKTGNNLVIDMGSSTINITALGNDSNKTLYSSGDNRFGGRHLDALIATFLVNQFSDEEKALFDELNVNNSNVATRLLVIAASRLKEQLSTKSVAHIHFSCMMKMLKLEKTQLEIIVTQISLKNAKNLIPEMVDEREERSWADRLSSFLVQEREKMFSKGIVPEIVILTGGGSAMPISQEICKRVFKNVQSLNASESSTVIARGLALCAKNADLANQFRNELKGFTNKPLKNIIDIEYESLENELAKELTDAWCNKLLGSLVIWRDGILYNTLEEVYKANFAGMKMETLMRTSDADRIISDWFSKKLRPRIQINLNNICEKYGAGKLELPKKINIRLTKVDMPTYLDGDGIAQLADFAGILVRRARKLISDERLKKMVNNNKSRINVAITEELGKNQKYFKLKIKKEIISQIETKTNELKYELFEN